MHLSMQTLWGEGGRYVGKGSGFDQGIKILVNNQGWGSLRSSNVVKNPHPGAKYQVKDKLSTYIE